MFALVHSHVQDDPVGIAEQLEAITNFLSYAVEGDNFSGDASARTGAALLVGAIGSALADLQVVTRQALKESEEAGYDRGFADGQENQGEPTMRLDLPHNEMIADWKRQTAERVAAAARGEPDLTEPAPPARRRKRAG